MQFHRGMQNFTNERKGFERKSKIHSWEEIKQLFSGERRRFANRRKVSRGEAKVLRTNRFSLGDAKVLQTVSQTQRSNEHKVFRGNQKFCERTERFSGEHKSLWINATFLRGTQNFTNEQNVSQGNAEVLRTDTKFLAGTQKFCELMQSFSGGSNFTNERKVSKGDSNVLRTNAKFLGGMQKFFFSITMSLKGSDISCNCNERCTLSCSWAMACIKIKLLPCRLLNITTEFFSAITMKGAHTKKNWWICFETNFAQKLLVNFTNSYKETARNTLN